MLLPYRKCKAGTRSTSDRKPHRSKHLRRHAEMGAPFLLFQNERHGFKVQGGPVRTLARLDARAPS